jgi:hypothetical protein
MKKVGETQLRKRSEAIDPFCRFPLMRRLWHFHSAFTVNGASFGTRWSEQSQLTAKWAPFILRDIAMLGGLISLYRANK